MSRLLRVVGDLAFDSITTAPNIEIPINASNEENNLNKNLALKVTSKEDYILVSGVFNFKIIAGVNGVSNSDFVNINIEFYRGANRIIRAYKDEWQTAGLTLSPGNYLLVNIPIQFTEPVTIPVTSEIAEYYVSIYITTSVESLVSVILQQYSISGIEMVHEDMHDECSD